MLVLANPGGVVPDYGLSGVFFRCWRSCSHDDVADAALGKDSTELGLPHRELVDVLPIEDEDRVGEWRWRDCCSCHDAGYDDTECSEALADLVRGARRERTVLRTC